MLLQAQFVYGHNTGVRVFARRSVLISLARRTELFEIDFGEMSSNYVLLCYLKPFKNELEWLHNAMALTCLHT